MWRSRLGKPNIFNPNDKINECLETWTKNYGKQASKIPRRNLDARSANIEQKHLCNTCWIRREIQRNLTNANEAVALIDEINKTAREIFRSGCSKLLQGCTVCKYRNIPLRPQTDTCNRTNVSGEVNHIHRMDWTLRQPSMAYIISCYCLDDNESCQGGWKTSGNDKSSRKFAKPFGWWEINEPFESNTRLRKTASFHRNCWNKSLARPLVKHADYHEQLSLKCVQVIDNVEARNECQVWILIMGH